VSTRREREQPGGGPSSGTVWRRRSPVSADPAEEVAQVACSRRDALLSFHRHRLSREDLEDCYSQATVELLSRARRAGGFASRAHIANALEQRLLSRIYDRRRAVSGRSPAQAALARALPLASGNGRGVDPIDLGSDVERAVLMRHELLSIARRIGQLSSDQRLVLTSQICWQMECAEFCRIHGWSSEKYRKVAQRGRARLARLCSGRAEPVVPVGASRSDQSAGTDL
jgi:DNA-directed RNA polymerase specialized sigma24 family protein